MKFKIPSGFMCSHCKAFVSVNDKIGTRNRNHCPFCLWSMHVDDKYSGDRKSQCRQQMKHIGLTFKKEGIDKYGKQRQGEIMVIHKCMECDFLSPEYLSSTCIDH